MDVTISAAIAAVLESPGLLATALDARPPGGLVVTAILLAVIAVWSFLGSRGTGAAV